MKQLGVILLMILWIAGFSACSKASPYDGDIQIMKEICNVLNNLSTSVNIVKDADGIIMAIGEFIPKYKAIKPKVDEMVNKYPYFGRSGGEDNAPEELKPHLKRVREAFELLHMSVKGMLNKWHIRNEEITPAVQELYEVMQGY